MVSNRLLLRCFSVFLFLFFGGNFFYQLDASQEIGMAGCLILFWFFKNPKQDKVTAIAHIVKLKITPK
jgi:hypothetical protein